MRTAFTLAGAGGGLAVLAVLVVIGGVIGGLIGLQTPDPQGPLSPDLSGGMRGAYAGLAAAAVVGLPLAALTAWRVRRWGRRTEQ